MEQEVVPPELPPTGAVDAEPETPRQKRKIAELSTELREEQPKRKPKAATKPKAPPAAPVVREQAAPPDILYRVRMDRTNEPLRYSLRSLAHLPHGEVFIVGYAPPWVDRNHVTVLDGAKTTIKWRAGIDQFKRGVEQLPGRKLVLIDDDMFVLAQMDVMPVFHAGPLADHAAGKVASYGRTFQNTLAYLKELGIEEPLSYERHVPLPVDADAATEALSAALAWSSRTGKTVQGRSVYGNVAGIGGTMRDDAKRKEGTELPPDLLSVDSASWRRGWATVIRRLFPTPSEYEV